MNIESMLREELADDARQVDVVEDPWPVFSRREVRHRRTRRARRTVSVLALVGALGLQFGVLPTPGWAPVIAVASTNSELVDSPIRGSLAGDAQWLDAMRGQVQDIKEDEGLWRVDRSKVEFLYASDVGAMRMALAYVPMQLGVIASPQLVWFAGKAGASPEAMEQWNYEDAGAGATAALQAAPDGTNIIVVVGPSGSTAGVSPGFEYTAEGRLQREATVSGQAGSGIAEIVFPSSVELWAMEATVEDDGRVDHLELGNSWNSPDSSDEKLDALVTKALGNSDFDRATLRSWLESALYSTGDSLDGLLVDLRWTGTVNGADAAVFTLQEPGQGVVVFANHGDADSSREDLRMLMPAAGAADRPIAWRMRVEDEDTQTDRVLIVAPEKAASLSVEIAGQAPMPVQLDSSGLGEVAVAPDQEASVVAYRADGTELSRSPVLPFDSGAGAIGETRATRLVP